MPACANISLSSPIFLFLLPARQDHHLQEKTHHVAVLDGLYELSVASGGHDSGLWSGACLQAMYFLLLVCLDDLLNDPYMPYLKRLEKGKHGLICMPFQKLTGTYITALIFSDLTYSKLGSSRGNFPWISLSILFYSDYRSRMLFKLNVLNVNCWDILFCWTSKRMSIQTLSLCETPRSHVTEPWLADINIIFQLAIKVMQACTVSIEKSSAASSISWLFRCSSGRSSVVLCPGCARISLQSSIKI